MSDVLIASVLLLTVFLWYLALYFVDFQLLGYPVNIKIYVLAFISFLAIGFGCANTTLARISADEDIEEMEVQGLGLLNFLPDFLTNIELDVRNTEAFESEDFDYITEIKFRRVTFDITSASTDYERDFFEDGVADNFDFFTGLELFIQATFDGEQQRQRIAFLTGDDEQLRSARSHLDLKVENLDIIDYVEADGGYELLVKVSGRLPPDNVIFDGNVVYRIGVGFH